MRCRWSVALLCLAAISVPGWADRLVLVDGTERAGVVSRIVLRESVELLQVNRETNEARISSFGIASVDRIELDQTDTTLYTLIYEAGDAVTGTLLSSPMGRVR